MTSGAWTLTDRRGARRRLARLLAAIAFLIAGPAAADGLPRPTGLVLLEVDGAIANRNAGDAAHFDRSMLEALGDATIETTTIWTDGVKRFRGTPVRALLDAVGADGDRVDALAHDDYRISIPIAELLRYDVLLALKMDGAPLTARTKGPIWMMYPQDAH
ncbi:MAG: molybdopterin-dependent oxidoreductase, partial [Pseudomonadota bacterium]